MVTNRRFSEITGTDERGKVGDRIISIKNIPEEERVIPMSRGVCKALRHGECYFVDTNAVIEHALRELKKNELTSDNEFFRLAIINYELGDLSRAIVYAHRFRDSDKALFRDGFKSKGVILSEGKLAMADLLTMLNMLCISLGWDFSELRKLGMEHLDERQKDFKRDGWSEVK